MANPTSNFGWQMPTSTDLVTDLPADFETFGQAVDTSLADLKGGTTGQVLTKNSNTDMDFVWSSEAGDISSITASSPLTGGGTTGAVTVGIQDGTTTQKGAVQLENSTSSTSTTTAAVPASVKSAYDLAAAAVPKSTVTTNGDLIYGTGSGTLTRLGIGSSGQALLVSGGVPSWGTVSAGANWSLLGSASLTGASTITISGISGKNKLFVVVSGASSGSANDQIILKLNNVSANYNQYGIQLSQSSSSSVAMTTINSTGGGQIRMGYMSNSASSAVSGYIAFDGCNTSGIKTFTQSGIGNTAASDSQIGYVTGGIWDNSATVSSVVLATGGTNFDAGTIYVYSSVN